MLKIATEFWPVRFDDLVRRSFEPIAKSVGVPLRKLRKGVFEIEGRLFSLRVREGTGHGKDFLVTLVSSESKRDDLDDTRGEIGLRVIAEFVGEPLPDRDLFTPGRYRRAFAEAAASAEKLCVPYLSGARRDIEDIRQFVEKKIEASGIREKQFRFRRNVREEWL